MSSLKTMGLVVAVVGAGAFILGARSNDASTARESNHRDVREPKAPVRAEGERVVALRPSVSPPPEARQEAPEDPAPAPVVRRKPPWSPAERDLRAAEAEEETVRLQHEVEQEEIDARWSRDSERDIRAALSGIPGTDVVSLRCASKRCSLEALTSGGKASMDARRRITSMPGFARARIRKERTEAGTRFRTILARDGFTVTGEPDPTL